jgi:Tfp pilus assembly protein PilF/quercetin dioxygenase-like cupin family protein
MIVTDQFVFIHVHKTGGQTLNDLIRQEYPDSREIGYHFPRADIPAEYVDLPVIGMVRNPWDWYVSWYAFNKRPGINNPLFHVVSEGDTAGLRRTVTNLVLLGADRPESLRHREALEELLPATLQGNRGVGLTKDDIRNLAEDGTGYCAWLFERMLGDPADEGTHIGRFENLQDDFIGILKTLDVEGADALRQGLEARERKNVSRHSHYSHYYDDELRDLVAARDASVIDRFGYMFESVKPAGAVYEFPVNAYAGPNDGFRKLLGRGHSFLKLNDDLDVTAIRRKLEQLPAGKWLESERERIFDVHRDTQALLMIHIEHYQHPGPEYRSIYDTFKDDLQPVIDYVDNYYRNNGFVIRLILAKLVPGGKIPKHTDAGYSLLNCHRIHLPIVTNDDVVFHVDGEDVNMRAGELWEINNGTVHAVENRGDADRIHLIVDWMPNYDGKSVQDVLAADELAGEDSDAANEAMLAEIIGRAHRWHQSGDVGRAESLYRQVLHFDKENVIANNLMGLLCLQTRRFDDAVRHIGQALTVKADDAQAHANLGLALNGLGRLEDAANEFHESLKLDPNNPVVYTNLGNVYIALRRIKDAVACYQQALAIQPGIAETHHNLAAAQMQLRQYREAEASLQRCLDLRPDFPDGQQKLERIRQLIGGEAT